MYSWSQVQRNKVRMAPARLDWVMWIGYMVVKKKKGMKNRKDFLVGVVSCGSGVGYGV